MAAGLPQQVQVRRWRGAACFQSFRRRFHDEEECCERRPSQVDSRLLFGDSDRLLAGVARLFYRHTVEGDAFESSGLKITVPEQKGRGVPLRAADFDEVHFAEQLNCKRSLSLFVQYPNREAILRELQLRNTLEADSGPESGILATAV
eukprot:s3131_g1.t1